MSNTRMVYFENQDILHLSISEGSESGSVELSPNITAELNDKGKLIGIEIITAVFIRVERLSQAFARIYA